MAEACHHRDPRLKEALRRAEWVGLLVSDRGFVLEIRSGSRRNRHSGPRIGTDQALTPIEDKSTCARPDGHLGGVCRPRGLWSLSDAGRLCTIPPSEPRLRRQPPASSAGRARITGAICVRRPGNDATNLAISGPPRGVKAWPQLFLGWRPAILLRSDTVISGHAR